jgi:hypothetical protein
MKQGENGSFPSRMIPQRVKCNGPEADPVMGDLKMESCIMAAVIGE